MYATVVRVRAPGRILLMLSLARAKIINVAREHQISATVNISPDNEHSCQKGAATSDITLGAGHAPGDAEARRFQQPGGILRSIYVRPRNKFPKHPVPSVTLKSFDNGSRGGHTMK